MKNRIRQFRKKGGLTQGMLAERLGTTAATVSRLESEDIALSLDWLDRIAAALEITPSQLLEGYDAPAPIWLGSIARSGEIQPSEPERPMISAMPEGAGGEVYAAGFDAPSGPFMPGETVIAIAEDEGDIERCGNHDCLVQTDDGRFLAGRLLLSLARGPVLAPFAPGAPLQRPSGLRWAARIVAVIRPWV